MDISNAGADMLSELMNKTPIGNAVSLTIKNSGLMFPNAEPVNKTSDIDREAIKDKFKEDNSFLYDIASDGAFVGSSIYSVAGDSPIMSTMAGFIHGAFKGGLTQGLSEAATAFATNKMLSATDAGPLLAGTIAAGTLVSDHYFDKWIDERSERVADNVEHYSNFSASDMLEQQQSFNEKMNSTLVDQPNTSQEVEKSATSKFRA